MSSARLDVHLVTTGLARSRGHARDLVTGGHVVVDGITATKVSSRVSADDEVRLVDVGPQWVGRAAHKLVAALEAFGPDGLDVTGRRCLDVGAGAGGFTQALLRHGAERVIALDVGHGQLATVIAEDPRVEQRSGTTIRGLVATDIGGAVDVLVCDLSFISLTLVLETLAGLVTPGGHAVILVKPQFEVGRARLGNTGVVRSGADRRDAVVAVLDHARRVGWSIRGVIVSPIHGGEGNIEYLAWLTRDDAVGHGWEAVISNIDALCEEGTR